MGEAKRRGSYDDRKSAATELTPYSTPVSAAIAIGAFGLLAFIGGLFAIVITVYLILIGVVHV